MKYSIAIHHVIESLRGGFRRAAAFLFVFVCAACCHGGAVSFDGRQIRVDDQAFLMKGVCYSPTPIGMAGDQPPFGDFYTTNYRSLYGRDLPLMRQMGVNCARVYGWSLTGDHTEFLDMAFNGGKQPIYVIINRWVDPNTDWSSASAVDAIKAEWRTLAMAARDHPALLGYAIGNELNLANGADTAFWTAINDIAGAVRGVDAAHLITTPLADANLLSQIHGRDGIMTNLNCWAVQMYRGGSFSQFFPGYARVSAKPLLVLEFGLDAFDARTGAEYADNAALAASYLESLWNDIVAHANIVSGGAVFAWSDEWWKSTAPAAHDAGGWNNASFPDGRADEEWWGIHRVSAGNPNTLEPRAAFSVLQNLWFAPPAAPRLSAPLFTPEGQFQTTVTGTSGYTYAVWSSPDLSTWTARQTNLPPFTFTDSSAAAQPRQFYRAVHAP